MDNTGEGGIICPFLAEEGGLESSKMSDTDDLERGRELLIRLAGVGISNRILRN